MTPLDGRSAMTTLDGVTLTLLNSGGLTFRKAGQGPAIVLCHGGRGSWNHWYRNIAALAQRFTVYVPDLPGFGQSMRLNLHMTMSDYLPIAVAAISEMCREEARFSLVGFSFGGMTAAGIAGELGERVHKLSLLAPAGWGSEDRPPDSMLSLKGAVTDEEINAVHRHNLGVMLLNNPANITDESVAFQRYNIESASFNSARASMGGYLFTYLDKVRCPVQVIIGTADSVQTPSVEARVARLAQTRPNDRVDLIEGAGHLTSYDQPDAYNAALMDFLADPE